jgi:dephospho-CoA kinase
MKVCGLTGGVGMGKSTAASFLLKSGFPVIDTDDLARELVQPGLAALSEIRHAFGAPVFLADGSLDRVALAQIVFSSSSARHTLESILHPRIRERWLAEIDRWREARLPLGFVVIPLLFETKAEAYFDKILCVACSPSQQYQRLSSRGWAPDQIKRRQSAQWPIEKKIAPSHYVVWTEGKPETSHEQLRRIVSQL